MMESWLTWIKTPVIFGVLALAIAGFFYFRPKPKMLAQ